MKDLAQAFFEFSPDLHCLVGMDGFFKKLSPSWSRHLGYSEEELKARPVRAFIHPDDVERTIARFSQARPGETVTNFENRCLSKDGSCLWLLWSANISADGEWIIASAREITEYKLHAEKQQKEIERQKKFLTEVVNHLPVALFCKDGHDDFSYVLWNHTAHRMWGISVGDAIGKRDSDFFPSDQTAFFRQKDVETLQGGRIVVIPEEPIATQHQGLRYLRTYKVPIPDESGAPRYLLGISEDITERKRIEEQVRVYQQVAQEMNIGLYVYRLEERGNPDSLRLIVANRASEDLTGVPSQQIVGKRIAEAFPSLELASVFHDVLVRNVSEDLGVNRYSLPEPKGEQFYRCRAFAMQDDHVAVLFENVTERVRTEKALEAERAVALHSARMASLGEMSAGIAHEINNPLAVIIGKAQNIWTLHQRGILDSETLKKYIDSVVSTAERIAKIIRGLKAFSREAEDDPFEIISICSLLDETLSFCNARFKFHDVKLEVESPPDSMKVQCRPSQISQILLNLLNNSLDAVEELPEKWVRIEIRDCEDEVEMSVTDSGKGIPVQIRDKIMLPFFTTKQVGKGTGLGLSISRGILASHQGSLTLDTECANTRFVVRLPKRQLRRAEDRR